MNPTLPAEMSTLASELASNTSNCLGSNDTSPKVYSHAEKVLYTMACVLFCAVGLLGNVAVIIVIYKDRIISRHKQNLYLLSLAAADAALVVLVVPFSFANEVLGGVWPFGSVYCRIYLSIDIMLCTASIWNICFIGIDRYVSVSYPTTYRRFRTGSRIRLCIISIWAYSATLSLLPFFSGEMKKIHGDYGCFINDSSWFIILSTSLSFFIPAFIVWPVYLKIYLVGRNLEIKRRQRRSSNMGEEKNASHHSRLSQSSKSRGTLAMTDLHKHEEGRGLVDAGESGVSVSKNGLSPSQVRKASSTVEALASSRAYLKPADALAQNNCKSVSSADSGRDSVFSHTSLYARFDKRTSSTTTAHLSPKPSRSYGAGSTIFEDIYAEHHAKSFYNECMKGICCSQKAGVDAQLDEEASFLDNGRSEGEASRVSVSNPCPSISTVTSNIKRSRMNRESFTSQTSTCTSISRRERRFVMIICIVMGCFMACWLPFFSTYIVYAICRDSCCIDDQLFKVFFWLGYLNSAINPLLYTIFNKDFRRAFRRIFTRRRTG